VVVAEDLFQLCEVEMSPGEGCCCCDVVVNLCRTAYEVFNSAATAVLVRCYGTALYGCSEGWKCMIAAMQLALVMR
jgi:hypothetical protein